MLTAAPTRNKRPAFTIVEMLVVIGILTLLMGLLLPTLAGARKKARKTRELNHLRQVGLGWTMYANGYDDAVIPGYLDTDVQERWDVAYEYPDRRKIPPAPLYADSSPNIAGPWTWRLMPYLDNSHDTLHWYKEEVTGNILEAMEDEAEEFALTPGFGYNAYYVGGWWTIGEGDIPRARFSTYPGESGGLKPTALVTRSLSQIRRSGEMVIFGSSAWRDTGIFRREEDDHLDGAFYLTPPLVGPVRVWGPVGVQQPSGSAHGGGQAQRANTGLNASGDPYSIQVFTTRPTIDTDEAPAPIGRYTGTMSLLFADGHVSTEAPATLTDPRRWINTATTKNFKHDPNGRTLVE